MLMRVVCFVLIWIFGYVVGRFHCHEKVMDLEDQLDDYVSETKLLNFLETIRVPEPAPGKSGWNGCINTLCEWIGRQ